MKKNYILCLVASLGLTINASAQSSIADARAMGEGATVTVKGIVTNGPEFGNNLRYLQDNTGGIAAFSSKVSAAMPGDSIEVTGTLKQYNNLLEIDPVDNATIINSGNALPAPKEIQLAAGFAEANEGVLVRVNAVKFKDAGDFSATSKNYDIEKSGTTKQVRINAATDIAGTTIPAGDVDVIGIMSQFSSTSPTSGFQLLPRSLEDLVVTTTGVSVVKNISGIQVYPNPVTENTIVSFLLNTNENISVSIVSIDGKEVKNITVNKQMNKGLNTLSLPIDGLAKGVYFLQIRSLNDNHTQKITIQ